MCLLTLSQGSLQHGHPLVQLLQLAGVSLLAIALHARPCHAQRLLQLLSKGSAGSEAVSIGL